MEHGPSPVHRMRFVNVRRADGEEPPLSEVPVPVGDNDLDVTDLDVADLEVTVWEEAR